MEENAATRIYPPMILLGIATGVLAWNVPLGDAKVTMCCFLLAFGLCGVGAIGWIIERNRD